jgi:hypothetical protein
MKIKVRLYLFLTATVLMWAACRKTDSQSGAENSSPSVKESRFFSEHRSVNPQVDAITQWIKQENDKKNFVGQTVKQIGYPRWDKALVKTTGQNLSHRGGVDSSFTIFLIPFVRDSQNYVNASLVLKATQTDTTMGYICDWQYSDFGYSPLSDTAIRARNVFHLFTLMDNNIFGYKDFKVNDKRLYTHQDSLAILNSNIPMDSAEVVYSIDSSGISGRQQSWSYEICTNYTVCVHLGEGNKIKTGVSGRGSSLPGGCATTATWTYCTVIEVLEPGDLPTGGGTGTGGTGSGSGSGAGGTPPASPCPTATAGNRGGIYENCTPGWTPMPATNNLGYYYSRLSQLYDSLVYDPYFLINPCNYLNQFKAIGNFQVPTSVINRLDTLNSIYYTYTNVPNFVNSPFYVRDLNSAHGAIVNCDYFPIHITTLPTINGVQWTAQQLFDYFRRNKNNFLDTSIAKFKPYIDLPFIIDTTWYNTNPMGALLHLSMINDGTVVVSDYYSTLDSSRYIVSTINSPLDGIHPVSGNRVWGINVDHTYGGYNFYTSAVDRITNPFFDLLNDIGEITPIPSGFEQADNLWRSMQVNMINFINNNQGNASYYTGVNEVKFRPIWFLLKEFLKGNISLQQLKAAMGC